MAWLRARETVGDWINHSWRALEPHFLLSVICIIPIFLEVADVRTGRRETTGFSDSLLKALGGSVLLQSPQSHTPQPQAASGPLAFISLECTSDQEESLLLKCLKPEIELLETPIFLSFPNVLEKLRLLRKNQRTCPSNGVKSKTQ